MEIRKFTFTLDVAVRDGAPVIDVADTVEEAVKSAHHDVLAVELRFDCGDKPGKAPAAGRKKRKYVRKAKPAAGRKKRKYVRKAKPADPGVSPDAVKVERRGTIPAGANAPEAT